MSNTIRSLMRGRWHPSGWDGSTFGRSGSKAANWSQSGPVSHDGSTGTGSPVITERRNSMITETCARLAAWVPHPAYPRGLLHERHSRSLADPWTRRGTKIFQFGVGDGEPTEAVLMSAPRNGSSGGVPDVARAPAAARGSGASATWPDHRAAPGRPQKHSAVGFCQEPSIPGPHASAVPYEDIPAGHDHERRPPPAAKNPLVSPPPLTADHRHSVPLQQLIGPAARRATSIPQGEPARDLNHTDQRQHAQQPERARIRPGFAPRAPGSKTNSS